MSQEEQRHGRQLPLATSGVITFNGVPLSPLTAGAESDGDDDDVVIVDACNNGKRKVGDGEEEGRGSQGGDDDDDVVAVHGGGGGGGNRACMFASSRVEIIDGAIAYIKMLQGEEVRMEAQKQELQRERDRLAMEIDMPDRQPQFVHPKVFEAMYRAAAAEIAAWINCY
ncbi:hypothetical protein OsJ_07083 [Oryza sativa Japonica Group]|uniref:Uncharacterized protein n=1 Tax=Oryza sativa subsp. japonica TaxID=39947 RepID=B9F0H1_ORYSJ|nr:hypothetical protein OsJ_07083 [Oryza sativa Japonica Group]